MTTRPAAPGGVPPFLVLAAHPLRWRMLVELAESDRQVGELTRATGRPQALVSYHLARLRAGGLVSSHKSSFDGRAVYYRVHLEQCRELLALTGAALHPGLRSDAAPTSPGHSAATAAAGRRRAEVLFLCTGNGSRSQIAEALLRDIAGDRVDVVSAGSHPKPIHPHAIKVLAERGIDISDARSKPLTEFTPRRFDFVITLCDKVREICPQFDGEGRTMHWSIEDPSRMPAPPTGSPASPPTPTASLVAFRELAADLASRIGFLTTLIDTQPNKENFRNG